MNNENTTTELFDSDEMIRRLERSCVAKLGSLEVVSQLLEEHFDGQKSCGSFQHLDCLIAALSVEDDPVKQAARFLELVIRHRKEKRRLHKKLASFQQQLNQQGDQLSQDTQALHE